MFPIIKREKTEWEIITFFIEDYLGKFKFRDNDTGYLHFERGKVSYFSIGSIYFEKIITHLPVDYDLLSKEDLENIKFIREINLKKRIHNYRAIIRLGKILGKKDYLAYFYKKFLKGENGMKSKFYAEHFATSAVRYEGIDVKRYMEAIHRAYE